MSNFCQRAVPLTSKHTKITSCQFPVWQGLLLCRFAKAVSKKDVAGFLSLLASSFVSPGCWRTKHPDNGIIHSRWWLWWMMQIDNIIPLWKVWHWVMRKIGKWGSLGERVWENEEDGNMIPRRREQQKDFTRSWRIFGIKYTVESWHCLHKKED